MKNGHAFQMFTEEVVKTLEPLSVTAYFAQPLPADTDGRIREILDRFGAATPAERQQFQQTLPPEIRSLFGIYGHRAATLAARQSAPAWLRSGLTGFAVANFTIPEKRKVAVGMAVYFHVAQKLGVNPIDLFEDVAEMAAPEIGAELLAFGRRGDVSLTRYGWRELNTPEGVKYKFIYG